MISRRGLLLGALAAPFICKAENLMPMVPTYTVVLSFLTTHERELYCQEKCVYHGGFGWDHFHPENVTRDPAIMKRIKSFVMPGVDDNEQGDRWIDYRYQLRARYDDQGMHQDLVRTRTPEPLPPQAPLSQRAWETFNGEGKHYRLYGNTFYGGE